MSEHETEKNSALNFWPILYGSLFVLTLMTVTLPFANLELLPIELPLFVGMLIMSLAVTFTHPALLSPYAILVAIISFVIFPESTMNPLFLWIAIALTVIVIAGFVLTRKTIPIVKRSKKPKAIPTFEPTSESCAVELSETPVSAEETPLETPEPTSTAEVSQAPFDASIASEGITIIFGTESGHCEDLANQAADGLKGDGYTVQVLDAENVKVDYLASFANVLILTSTWGDGDPPSNAEELMNKLKGGAKPDMSGSQFSVLALGDSDYDQFCKCGKEFDEFLAQFGSHRFHDRMDCDVEFEETYDTWIAGVQASLKASGLKQKAGAPVASA